MAILARVRTVWSGSGVVGPGVSTFYFDQADTGFVSGVHAFFLAGQSMVPSSVTWTTAPEGDLIDSATGNLVGLWTDGTLSTVSGTNTNIYAAGVGARIKWKTNAIVGKRRLAGSTFICPMGNDSWDNSGTLSTSRVTLLNSMSNALVGKPTFTLNIWHRPSGPGAVDGQAGEVVNSSVPDQVSWLRSRRL